MHEDDMELMKSVEKIKDSREGSQRGDDKG